MLDNTIPELPVEPEIPETPDFPEDYIPPMEEDNNAEGAPAKDWMAIVALVCGGLSLCGSVFAPLGCLMSVAAIVLGILGLKSTQRTIAVIGLIVGGLGVLLSLVFGVITLSSLFFITESGY